MTLLAILTKLVLVRIFMAAGTTGEWNTPELLENLPVNCFLFMTLYAFYAFVLTYKLEL